MEWTLADKKKETTLKKKCIQHGATYTGPNDLIDDTKTRHAKLNAAIKKKQRGNESPSKADERRNRNKRCMQNTRENESPSKADERKGRDKSHKQNTRASESELQAGERKGRNNSCMQNTRANESELQGW